MQTITIFQKLQNPPIEIARSLAQVKDADPNYSIEHEVMHKVWLHSKANANPEFGDWGTGYVWVNGLEYYYNRVSNKGNVAKGPTKVKIRDQIARKKYQQANPSKGSRNLPLLVGIDITLHAQYIARRDALTKSTGIQYHLDHILPINLQGTHSHRNWQLLTDKENLSKGKNYDLTYVGEVLDNGVWIPRPKNWIGEAMSGAPIKLWAVNSTSP